MATIKEIAKKYGKTESEVKLALPSVGYDKRIAITSKVEPEFETKLDALWRQQKATPSEKTGQKKLPRERKIESTQIVEKRQRRIRRPVPAKPEPAPTPEVQKPVVAQKASTTTKTPATPTKKNAVSPKTETSPTSKKSPAVKPVAAKKTAATESPQEITPSPTVEKSKKAVVTTTDIPPSPTKPPAPNSLEDLYQKQVARQEELREKQQTATKNEKTEEKSRRGGTIKIDQKILRERQKRRQQRKTTAPKRLANQHGFQKPVGLVVREIEIPETISVSRIAEQISLKSGIIIRKLMDYGMTANANTSLDKDTAWIVVEELGHKPVAAVQKEDSDLESLRQHDSDLPQEPRPPVVTVMGHVDHGKTSLLDYIRKTRVANGEAGGITQHIGAYQVSTATGAITFLDTPGHALFSEMRARGAQITDIVVLVVAGDDGVKPQTEEAISHAQAADVPIVVAINKMDKPGVDIERIKSELSARGVMPEEWGGDSIFVPISALTGNGVDTLLDSLRTQSDILDIKATRDCSAQAAVVEARVEKGHGVVATLVVRSGTLKNGDCFVCGTESGRVRSMWDSSKKTVKEATPAMPVEIQGLSGMPEVGEDLFVVPDERKARDISSLRQEKDRTRRLNARAVARPSTALLMGDETEKKELNVIVKADVGGSREALLAALSAIHGKKAAIKVIHSAVGSVTESDINLAHASGALIVAFNVRPDTKSRKLAQSYGIKIMHGNVIYEIVENAEKAVLNLLDMVREEKIIGTAKVLKVFTISKIGNIAGCSVQDGNIRADAQARLLRDGAVVYEGAISSLRHFKESAKEARMGEECGIGIHRFNDIKAGDVIEAIEVLETAPTL